MITPLPCRFDRLSNEELLKLLNEVVPQSPSVRDPYQPSPIPGPGTRAPSTTSSSAKGFQGLAAEEASQASHGLKALFSKIGSVMPFRGSEGSEPRPQSPPRGVEGWLRDFVAARAGAYGTDCTPRCISMHLPFRTIFIREAAMVCSEAIVWSHIRTCHAWGSTQNGLAEDYRANGC